ncbi:MAG: caspase family protein, partial [Gammaproteobacteria bacterium]|nr:caspase family protein [Gammaproteobacteria bacterium]
MTALTVAVAAGSPARAQPSAVSGVAVPDSGARSLYAESHALLVGVSDYTAGWPDLESVPRELEQVQAVLEAQGFRVVKRLNLTGEALKREFEAFIDAHGYHPKNRLLFFFAGHGHTWDEAGHGYLVPADAPVPAT